MIVRCRRTIIPMGWRERASCRDVDPELFFPVGSGVYAREQAEHAKMVCGHCAVTAECLDWALAHGEDGGVWGGMDGEERRRFEQTAKTRGAKTMGENT